MKRTSKRITALSPPQEIIHEEILPRLPVKSLLRLRCVSKSWRSLIGSKRFIKTQHQHSLQKRVILQKRGHHLAQCSLQTLLSEEPINLSPLDVTTDSSTETYRVLGCYNGLVCIRKYPGKFYLWNPSTRVYKKLRKIANDFYVVNCGFGWVETSAEYKVFALVCVFGVWGKASLKGIVYSSKTKSWKTIKADVHCLREVGVFVGGKLHWRNAGNDNDIVFLDLKSEVFGRIELPFDQGDWKNKRLGQIGGCLCVLYYNHGRDIRVWVMKESWETLVNLSLDHELLQRPFSASFAYKGSNGEIFVFDGSTFLVYNPRDNVFRLPGVHLQFSSYHVYVESLLSPKDVLGTHY